MDVYKIIRQVDKELKGDINLEMYEKRLQGLMDMNQIERSLFLFLVLLRMQDEVNEIRSN